MQTLRDFEASNPNVFESMRMTREKDGKAHRGAITTPYATLRTRKGLPDATITMINSKTKRTKSKSAWSKSKVSASVSVKNSSLLPSEEALAPWLSKLGATYEELEKGQEAELPTVATLHPASGSFIDILERSFGVEKDKPIELTTDFWDDKTWDFHNAGRDGAVQHQDDLLRETIFACVDSEGAKPWSHGGADRVHNSVFRTVAQQPGTLRWKSDDGKEHKRFVLYNFSEDDYADVFRR